jgi:integrase
MTTKRSGMITRHSKRCKSLEGGRCSCKPTFQAWVWDAEQGKKLYRTFSTPTAAKNWRRDASAAVAAGELQAVPKSGRTVAAVLEELIAGMKDGTVLDRSGRRYRPVTIRNYAADVRNVLAPKLGHLRMREVKRRDVQRLVDQLHADGLSGSTIRNKLDPLRVVFRRAIEDEEIQSVNPAQSLRLPALERKPKRIAAPDRAAELLDALPDDQRALWATAFYGGLRMGELRALRWRNVIFAAGLIAVEAGWDDVEGEQDPKTAAGKRTVPLVGRLRTELARHKLATGGGEDDLCFGDTAQTPPVRSTVRTRALRAWGWKQEPSPDGARQKDGRAKLVWVKAREDALDPLQPHEARHTCASYLAAAGLAPKDVQTAMGHAHIATTLDLYAKSVPGWEKAAAAKLDEWLDAHQRAPVAHQSGSETGRS